MRRDCELKDIFFHFNEIAATHNSTMRPSGVNDWMRYLARVKSRESGA
jgi:hypothetical protein